MITAGTIIALFFGTKQRNLGHVIAVLWALTGIVLKRNGASEAGSAMVAGAAIAGIGVLATVVSNSFWKKRTTV
jgi:3,4-dihydroxy-2-butanone 4-phosphate synthase